MVGSRILLEEDDDHTKDVDDDDDDDDPVELFQKRAKWWELIVCLPFPVMAGL